MNIRPIKAGDLDALVLLGGQAHAEGAFSHLDYDHRKMYGLLQRCISDGNHFCAVAETAEGGLVGFQISVIGEYWFGCDLIAEERVLYVLPGYRKSTKAGYQLTHSFVAWAEQKGAAEICAGTTLGIDTEGVKDFYERQGFDTVGYIFKKRI